MKTTHMLTILMTMFIMGTTSVMGQNRSMGRQLNRNSGRVMYSQPAPRHSGGPAVHHAPVVHHSPAIHHHRHHRPAPRPVYYATPRHCPPPPPHHHVDAAGIVAGAVVATTVGLLLGSLAY